MFPCPNSIHNFAQLLVPAFGRSHDQAVDAQQIPFLATQGGAFRAQQARKLYRWEQLREQQDLGLIVREGRSLYRVADAGADTASRLARAELAIGRRLIACHGSAADLFGFGVLSDGLLHVTTAEARSIRSPPGVKVHQMSLRSPPCVRGGLALVDPADSAIDVAAAASEIDVLAVLDAALRAGVHANQLDQAVIRAGRQRGIQQVRRLLPRANPLAESPMESRTRFRILEAGLPEPDLQVVVPVRHGGVRILDCGWRRAKVGLEFDGQDFHSGDGSLERDRRRGAQLIAAGWTVVHVTGADVYRSPERFTAPIRTLLRERGC